jgi:hypothetical protein
MDKIFEKQMSIVKLIKQITKDKTNITGLHDRMKYLQEALGREETRQIQQIFENINDAEFRVSSQCEEDVTIQYLINYNYQDY